MIVPDANLLIYAYNAGAPEHDMARRWWQGCVNGTESVGVPLLVAVSFVRIISNPKAVLPPLSAKVAADYMYNWLSYPHITLLQPGAAHWSYFQSLIVAADVRGNHPQSAFRNPEALGDPDPHHVRPLGPEIQDQFVAAVVRHGERGAAFERNRAVPVEPVFAGDGDLGRAAGCVDVAAFDDALDISVGGPRFVQERARAPCRLASVDDGRQLIDVERDARRDVFGCGAGRGEAYGHGLAGVTHLAHRERGKLRQPEARYPGRRPNGFDAREVGMAEDAAAGRNGSRIHSAQFAVGDRTADDRGFQRALGPDVGDEVSLAREVARVLLAQDARADSGGFGHGVQVTAFACSRLA